MAARAHNWMNRGCWVVEVESWMMASNAHLQKIILDSGLKLGSSLTSSLDVTFDVRFDVRYDLLSGREVNNLDRTPSLSLLPSPTIVNHNHLLENSG